MDLWRTQARGHRRVVFHHLRAVGDIEPAPGTSTTHNAIWPDRQDPNSEYLSGDRHRHFLGDVWLWLLGAGGASDRELAVGCHRGVARLPMAARSGRF